MKRKLASSSPSASRPPPKKRERGELTASSEDMPPLEGAAEQKPASESDIYVLQYQNRQLSNALQERKEEIVSLNSKIRGFTAKQSLYDNTLGFVGRNLDSFNESIQSILLTLDPSNATLEALLHEATNIHPSQETRTFLQLLLKDKEKEKATDEEEEEELDEKELAAKELMLKQKIDENLDKRVRETRDLLLKFVALVQKERNKRDEIASALKEKADTLNIQQALADENKALTQKIASLERMLEEVQHHNVVLKKQNRQCKDGWLQAEKRMRDTIVELEDVKMELSTARGRSKRLHDQLQEAHKKAQAAALQPAPGVQIKGEKPEPVEDAKRDEELAEYQMRDEERLREIQALRAERTEVAKELHSLKYQLANLPDNAVFKSPQYQLLHQQSRLALMDLESIRSQHSQLQHSFSMLDEQRKEERDALLKAESLRRKALEDEVRDKMGMITRLRGEREEMQYRLDQKKAVPAASKVAQDFKVILSSTQAQNKKLEKEVKRLKGELAQMQEMGSRRKETQEESDNNSNGTPTASSVSSTRGSNEQEAHEKIRSLQRTIEELQRRERKAEEAQREMKVMLDVYQSETKEQRDVTEIRRAERRVIEENKRLQTKLARYERDPKQGPPSGPPRPEGDKHRHEKPPMPGEKRPEHVDKAVAELKKALANEKREGEMLLQEMSAISKSFEELQEQNTRLLQQLSEKEDASTKLLSERIKSEQVQHLLRQETKALEQQLSAASEKYAQQTEILQKEGERIKLLEQQMEKTNEQCKQMAALIEHHKRTAREGAEQVADLRNRLEHTSNILAELKKANEDLIASVHKEEDKVARLAEERNSLKRRLDKYTSKGSADSMLEEELAVTKKMLICPVCNDRKKDTVITRCFHVFCNQCIRKNLALRHRKCPGCAKPFGEKDVQSIYLGYDHEDEKA